MSLGFDLRSVNGLGSATVNGASDSIVLNALTMRRCPKGLSLAEGSRQVDIE
jgi:hypothetical protein